MITLNTQIKSFIVCEINNNITRLFHPRTIWSGYVSNDRVIGCKQQTDLPHLHSLQGPRIYIMASQVVKHMNTHHLLYDLQHSFREKKSCETQLAMLVEDLGGKQTDIILLDFSDRVTK